MENTNRITSVYQDGGQFYCSRGPFKWVVSYKSEVSDLGEAVKAREWFLQIAEREKYGLLLWGYPDENQASKIIQRRRSRRAERGTANTGGTNPNGTEGG